MSIIMTSVHMDTHTKSLNLMQMMVPKEDSIKS